MLLAGQGSDNEHAARYQGSPLRRPGRAGIARNAAIALGQNPTERGRDALLRSLREDPTQDVRLASAWALSRAHAADAGVPEALDRARERSTNEAARRDIETSLERSP